MSRIINIPEGFTLVTDENYIIRDGDKYNLGAWIDKDNQTLPNLIGTGGYFIVAIGKTLKWAQENCRIYDGIYLFSKNNNQHKIPVGFTLVTDDNHIITENDKYNIGIWKNDDFFKADDPDWVGKTFGAISKQYSKYGLFRMITKGESKPRFKSDRPYPFGY